LVRTVIDDTGAMLLYLMNVGRTATETVPTLYVWRLANNDFKIGLLHERDTAIHDDDAGT